MEAQLIGLSGPLMVDDSDFIIISVDNGLGDAVLALSSIRYFFLLGCRKVRIITTRLLKRTVFAEFGAIVLSLDEQARSDYSALRAIKAESKRKQQRVIWCSLHSYSPLKKWEQDYLDFIDPHTHIKLSDFVFEASTGKIRSQPMRDAYVQIFGLSSVPDSVDRAPQVNESETNIARRLLKRVNPSGSLTTAVFHTDTSAEKLWPNAHWLKLAAELAAQDWSIIVVGRPAPEIELGPHLVSFGKYMWRTQVSILANAQLFIGVDSCFAHIADALGIPGFVLFGPTSERLWGPRGPKLRALVAPARELRMLSADAVIDQVRHLFAGSHTNF